LKRYEVVCIVKSDLPEEDISNLIERSEKIITKGNGLIAQIDKWGKKRLAYEIDKQKEGFYFLIDFAGDGSVVNEIERNYKIDDKVLKFMTVKKEGAVTREGIDTEIAAAQAKKNEAATSPEKKITQQAEKTIAESKDSKTSVEDSARNEEQETKKEE